MPRKLEESHLLKEAVMSYLRFELKPGGPESKLSGYRFYSSGQVFGNYVSHK
jgi:hypothetical protein